MIVGKCEVMFNTYIIMKKIQACSLQSQLEVARPHIIERIRKILIQSAGLFISDYPNL